MQIREAFPADATVVATVRIDTWRAAYAGLIPAGVLDALDIVAEAPRHEERLRAPRTGSRELVAEVEGRVVGWASVGGSADEPTMGELHALYVLPEHWGTGMGHALLEAAETLMRGAGARRAVLWHLDGNERAARFYARHGWRLDGVEKDDERLVGGMAATALHELRRAKDLG